MTAVDLLAALASAGVSIRADGDELVLKPAGRLAADLLADVRANKAALLALLVETREAPPYRCWKPGCDGIAAGLWRRVGPDCWEADCSGGHSIQRAAVSFDLPLPVRGRPRRAES